MPKLKIVTSQNVAIDYELATVMERILCGAIDTFIQLIFVMIWSSAFSNTLFFYNDYSVLLFLIPVMIYSLAFETLFNGRTPAKIMLGIKVIRIYGDRAGFSAYFTRWVFRLFDVVITAGGAAITSIFFNKKAQRIGDIIAGTAVIKIKNRPTFNPLLISVPANYTIKYPEVKLLSEKDIATISEVLQFNYTMNSSVKAIKLMQKTRQKIENVLGIVAVGKNDMFFKTLINDYSAIHSQNRTTSLNISENPIINQNPTPNIINP